MADIYSQAAKVVAWLGPSNVHIDELFDKMNRFQLDELRNRPDSMVETNADTGLEAFRIFLKESPEPREVVRDLTCRRYWSRTWIVQEILLACEVELVCGANTIHWDSWIYLNQEVLVATSPSDSDPESLFEPGEPTTDSGMTTLYHECNERRTGKASRSLLSLVLRFAHHECLQLSDKVYAFLGLATDAHDLLVDYNMSRESLVLTVLATAPPSTTIAEIKDLCDVLQINLALMVLAMDLAILQNSLNVSAQHLSAKQVALLGGLESYPVDESQNVHDHLAQNIATLTEPKFQLIPMDVQRSHLWYTSCECLRCLHSEPSRQATLAYLRGEGAHKASNAPHQYVRPKGVQLRAQSFRLQNVDTEFAMITVNGIYLLTATTRNVSGTPCYYYESRNPHQHIQLREEVVKLSILQFLNLTAHQGLGCIRHSGVNDSNILIGGFASTGASNARYRPLRLREANLSGRVAVTNYLFSTGIFRADDRDQDGWTEMSQAIADNQKAPSFPSSRIDVSVDPIDYHQKSLLVHAIVNHNQEAMSFLASRSHVNVDQVDVHGKSPFIYAVIHRNRRAVSRLAKIHDVVINRVDNSGKSAFFYATSNRDWITVMYLLSRTVPNVNQSHKEGKGFLVYQIPARDREILEAVSSRTGRDINSVDGHGRSALMKAVSRIDAKDVALLASREDVDIDLVDTKGRNVLMYAATNVIPHFVKLFAAKVRNVSEADVNGNTALHHLAATWLWSFEYHGEDFLACLKSLTRYGASVKAINNRDQTAYDILRSLHSEVTCYDSLSRRAALRSNFVEVEYLIMPRENLYSAAIAWGSFRGLGTGESPYGVSSFEDFEVPPWEDDEFSSSDMCGSPSRLRLTRSETTLRSKWPATGVGITTHSSPASLSTVTPSEAIGCFKHGYEAPAKRTLPTCFQPAASIGRRSAPTISECHTTTAKGSNYWNLGVNG